MHAHGGAQTNIRIQPEKHCGEGMKPGYTSLLIAAAYAEHGPIGIPDVHLSHIPGHIGWRKRNFDSRRDALPMYRVNVFHPNGHPNAFISLFISMVLEGGLVGTSAAASLRASAEKDLAFTGTHGAECRWRSPIPALLPSPPHEPREGGCKIGHVQYRRETLGVHGRKHNTRLAIRACVAGA